MGKKDDLQDILNQFEQHSADSKKTELDYLKDAAQIVSQISAESLPSLLRATSSLTLKYLSLLVKCFDHQDASIRLFAEQSYDQVMKKLIISRNTELALRITIGNFQKTTSARGIVSLISKIEYFLNIIPNSKRGQNQKFDYLSDTIANRVLRILSRPEHIVQKAIYTHFHNIFTKLSPDMFILYEIKKTSTQLLFDTKGATARTISEVLFTLCTLKREWTNEMFKLSLEHIITFYQSGDKPSIGALLCLKKLLVYFDIDNNLDYMKKAIEILLILVANGPNDISFEAFAVLEELIKFIPSSICDFLPYDFITNGSQSNRSSSDEELISTPVKETQPDVDEIIDPLLNPVLYEEIQQNSASPAISVCLELPSHDTMLKDELVNVYKYIAAFLCKTFLLTGITGSLKSDNESKDSKKILAVQCLIVIAKIENISGLDVLFDKRSQKIEDLVEFFGHHDESLASKSINLISILMSHMESQNGLFNSQISQVLSQTRQNSLRKRTLLEAFSNEKIRNIYQSDVFPQLLDVAREMCKSENSSEQICGSSFISSLSLVPFEKIKYMIQCGASVQNDFLTLMTSGILPQNSSYFEHVKSVFGVSSSKVQSYPPSKIQLVLNFDPNLTLSPGLSHQQSLEYGYFISVMDMLTNSDSSTISNIIQVCQSMINETQYAVEILISIERIIAHLNSGEYKKHVVICFLQVLTKTCQERCMNLFMNARLTDCRETSYEVMLVALRCLDMIYKLTFEKRPDKKTLENLDARVVKVQNLFVPAKPNETGTSFPRQADINFTQCESLNHLYHDLQGSYINYCSSLNLATDQKLYEFIEACTNLCCAAFEFITIDDFNFFEDTIFYLKKLIDIAPSETLHIMHQLVKLLFKKNLISMERNLIMENGRFAENLMEESILKQFDLLTKDSEYSNKIINFSMGWLAPNVITSKTQANTNIEAALTQMEDLITVMIRVFRCRGAAEKKQVILVMIELIRVGIRYDMADPNHVILDEILKQLSTPQDCTSPELLPLMVECLIIINRISQKHDLVKFGVLLIQCVAVNQSEAMKHVIFAANILLMESINLSKDINELIEVLSQHLKICLKFAPEQTLYTWFLIFSSSQPEKIADTSIVFLTTYLEWMLDKDSTLNFKSLLFPLLKIPEAAFDHFDKIFKAFQQIELCSLKAGALLCAIVSRIPELVLSSKLRDLGTDSSNWLQKNYELNLSQSYKAKPMFQEFFSFHFLKNYKTLEIEHDGSPKLEEQPKFQFIVKSTVKRSKSFDKRTIEIEDLICEMTKSANHIDFATSLLVECEIEQQWAICQKLDKIFPSDVFWKHLMREYRFQIMSLDAKSAPDAQYLITKCQELIDLCIENCYSVGDYSMLLKVLANCKDIRLDLTAVTVTELNKILSFVTSKKSNNISTGYVYRGLNTLLSEHSIISMVQQESWKCLDSYLDLLSFIVGSDEDEHTVNSLFRHFKIDISDLIESKEIIKIHNQISRCWSISQKSSMNRSNISNDEIRQTRDILLRHPLIYPIFFISIPAIENQWKPSITVTENKELSVPLPKVHSLCYTDVLTDIKNKLLQVGWLNKPQFEDICVSLLGVLSTTPTGEEISDTPRSELLERIDYCAMAVDIFTFILLQTLTFPNNGDPASNYVLKMREKSDPFFSSNEAVELSILKCVKNGIPKHAFNQNIERYSDSNGDGTTKSFGVGQISVLSLWTICGAVPQDNGNNIIEQANRIRPSLSQHLLNTTSDLDTVSNVRSLLGIFSHWFSHGIDQLPDQLLESVIRSMLYLSDFFDDQSTYEFMYQQMKIIHDRGMTYDMEVEEMVRCMLLKSVAVLGIEHIEPKMELAEKKNMIMSWVADFEYERNNMFILGGISYLLQSFSLDSLKDVINELTGVFVAELKNRNAVYQNLNYYLAVATQILEQPNCNDISIELLLQLIDLLIDTKLDFSNQTILTITETMVQLICHSVIYVEPIITKCHRLIANSKDNNVLNKQKGTSMLKIYQAAILRSAAADVRHMEILKDGFADLLYLFCNNLVDPSEQIMKSLPILLVTIEGCDGSVMKILDFIFESTNYSDISKYLLILNEIYLLSRRNKSWGRLLRAKNEVINARLIEIKIKSNLIYCIIKLTIQNPIRVPALLPIDENTKLDLNWVNE